MTHPLLKVRIWWLIALISFVVICSIYTFSGFMAGSTVENAEDSAPHEKAVANLTIKELAATDPQENPVNADAVLPQFDVVRIAMDGSAVLAGRASPGAKVTVSNSRQVIGVVTANRQGEWVLVPNLPLTPGDTELRVESEQHGTKGNCRLQVKKSMTGEGYFGHSKSFIGITKWKNCMH